MEALILREEAFRKAVPAVTDLVYLVDADGVNIREGNQLNAGRSDGVEAGELSSRRCKSQWERLRAVAEEVAAGQNIVGVEVVVDLRDHAAQVVVRRSDERGIGSSWTSSVFPGAWSGAGVSISSRNIWRRPELERGRL